MMNIHIQQCREDDLPTLAGFFTALYEGHGDGVPDEGVAGRLSEYSLMAEVKGTPAGFIIAAVETIEFMQSEIGRSAFPDVKEYLEIQDLYVLEEFRGRGVGTKLIEGVLSRAKANGIKHAMVYSGNKDYIRTARFYEKSGFRMWHIFMTQTL
ncbi:MAG: GNAT family N-acetyltransferase [Sedimentisphaerales bacterium]|nr:GNAT family N-acetyltransferase [Sedimentisphaerales bacterium]